MKKKTQSVTIAVLALMDVKLGRIAKNVNNLLSDHDGAAVTLDLTGVDTYSTNIRQMEILAETLQERGICDPGITCAPGDKKGQNAIKSYGRIQRLLERRTVRYAFGEELCNRLDQCENTREARRLLNDPHDGSVSFIRFRTETEKKAYLRGICDAAGWSKHTEVDWCNGHVIKAARQLPVTPARG